MSLRQYVGARYVPKFYEGPAGSDWTANTQYEPLTIVTRNGNSYTSKKAVPASIGAPESNPDYWASTGIYNQQVEQYRQEVEQLASEVQPLQYIAESKPINILTLGAKNDGSEDVSEIINTYTNQYAIYMPIGIYRVDNPILLKNALIGANCNRDNYLDGTGEHADATVIKSYVANDFTVKMQSGTSDLIVKNLNISLRSSTMAGGILQNSSGHSRSMIENVAIYGLGSNTGIYINPNLSTSRSAFINNVSVFGDGRANDGSVGIRLSGTAYDSRITNCELMYIQRGIYIDGGLVYGSNIHIYSGGVDVSGVTQNFYEKTSCLYAAGDAFLNFSNVYCDSAYRPVNILGKGSVSINNFMYWDDESYDRFNRTGSHIFYTPKHECNLVVNGGEIYNRYKVPIMSLVRIMNSILNGVQIMVDDKPTSEDNGLAYPLYPSTPKDNYVLYHTVNGNFTINNYNQVASLYTPAGGYTTITISDVDNNAVKIIYDRLSNIRVHKKTLRGDMDVFYQLSEYGAVTKIYVRTKRTGTQYSVKMGHASGYSGVIQYSYWRKLDHTMPPLETLTSSEGLTEITEIT